MKKFKYSIIATLIAALALFVVSCSTGGDDDDYTPPYTPPNTLPGPVEVEAAGSLPALPSPPAAGTTTAAVALTPASGFSLTVAFELSADGSTYKLHLTVSGKTYSLNRVSGGEDNPLAATWELTGGSDDAIELTFDTAGAYTLSYTPEWIPIATAEQLQKIGIDYPLNGKYELTDNITLANWMPIGATRSTAFSGEFDGRGKTITLNGFDPAAYNKTIMISGGDWSEEITPLGVFWRGNNAEIKDFGLELNLGTGGSPLALAGSAEYLVVGGVVGYAEQTTVRDISLSGTLIVSRAAGILEAGGIAGRIDESEISGCTSSVTLSATAAADGVSAGGISAICRGNAAITNCHVTENISSSGKEGGETGGIAGHLEGPVTNCSVTGNVSGNGTADSVKAGGIAGALNGEGSSGSITNSYYRGNVSANSANDDAHAGGIAGGIYCEIGRIVKIQYCYAKGEVSASGGSSSDAGGIVGSVGVGNNGGTVTLQACAALNTKVSGLPAGRITSWSWAPDASLNNNIANITMNDTSWTSNANGKDGEDVSVPANQSDFQSRGWDFSTVWEMDSNYPVLKGQP